MYRILIHSVPMLLNNTATKPDPLPLHLMHLVQQIKPYSVTAGVVPLQYTFYTVLSKTAPLPSSFKLHLYVASEENS